MKSVLATAFVLIFLLGSRAQAQKSPEAGYVFPAGGKAGTTIDVKLGGYDWTPDMEFIVHDKRVQLAATGTPGPILIPLPPYWFGAKGRIVALPLPREVSAKLTIPADMPPGPLYWQAANANGVSEARLFVVGNGPEVVEEENRKGPQLLPSLPMTVSGRLMKNEEVDRYRFVAARDGPITCELMARRLGSKFVGILQVHDAAGKLIKDALGTIAADPALTFVAKGGVEYVVSLNDIDFAGDRSFVYRLRVTPGPRVVGAIPAAGMRGETRDVEFIMDNGAALESIKAKVAFPAAGERFEYRPMNAATAFPLLLSDHAEVVPSTAKYAGPIGITSVLDQPDAEHRHAFDWKKGDVWSIALEARRIGSPLDVAVAIVGPDGKELARNDDLPGTTDAGLEFKVPVDGTYQIVVSDMAGKSGSRAAIYRLAVRQPTPDFAVQLAVDRLSVPIGGQANLSVSAVRTGGFKGPIALAIKGLPPGVTAPPNLVIPANQPAFVIPLQGAKDAGTLVGIVAVEGTVDFAPSGVGFLGRHAFPPKPVLVTRTASAKTNVNLTPRGPNDGRVPYLTVATTLKPRFKGQPVDQDTGRKVYRGSTFPADVILERLEGYQGEITLQMAATQSYQVQGITGGEVVVPPGATKAIYPVFMPEWLETTRTSRCGMIAVAKVADPKGKVRWVCNSMTGFITMTLEGALLKVSAEEPDMTVAAGQPFNVRLKVARLTKLNAPATLELVVPDELAGKLKAGKMMVGLKQEQAAMRVTPASELRGLHTFAIRATALQDGKWLAVSEAAVTVEFAPVVQAPRK
jgi:hypothetical protein